jgi:hypothetical protein
MQRRLKMMKFKYSIIISLISILLLFIAACDFNNITNPADELEIRVKTISRDTFVSFEILDAKTNEPIASSIEAEVSGRDNGLVINEINEPTTFFTVENGILLFAIADGTEPSGDNPVKLNIILKADGYLSTSQPITVTKTGMNTYSTLMTNVDDTPTGVVSNQENAGNTSGNGGLADSTVVSSGEDSETGGEASISMGQGTQLMDGNGNVLTGEVEARVTYFNPLNEESTSAFPGGFNVEIEGEDEGQFTTAGFVAIDMEVNGTEVEQFNGDVNIDIKVPEGTMNPETGMPVQPGDEIPVYSYDEDNGTWKFEGTTVVPEQDALGKSTGTHTVSIKNVTHLSYWNLDWYDSYGSGNYCETGATLKFTSTTGNFQRLYVLIIDQETNIPVTWWSNKYIYPNDNIKTLMYAPRNKPVIVQVYDIKNVLVKSQNISDLCTTGEIEISFEPSYSILNVNIEVQVKCDNAGISLSGYPLYAKELSGNWKYLGTVSDGKISGAFDTGGYYDFAIYFDGQWYYTKDYADDIIKHAADNNITLVKNQYGYLQMTSNNSDITVLLKDIDSICNEF